MNHGSLYCPLVFLQQFDLDKDRTGKKTLGSFSADRSLMKLHGLLTGAFKNYKVNLLKYTTFSYFIYII